jgi:hypothetical protein
MLGEIVKKVAADLDEQIDEKAYGDPFLSSHNYRTFPFDVEHFRPLKVLDSNRRIAFVDGGNQPLLEAPNFSVQLNRIYFNIYRGRRRVNPMSLPQRVEFFSLTSAHFRNEQIFFDTSLYPLSEEFEDSLPRPEDLSFDSTDRRITMGNSRADITRVATIARRFAEWEMATHVIKEELKGEDVLVMDGTLRTAFANESRYAKNAYFASKDRGVTYTGLAKASRLFTTTGLSLIGALRKIAEEHNVGPTWSYHPIAESLSPEHEAAIFIVKLNAQSRRVYRYEIQAEQMKLLNRGDIDEILSQLSANAADLSLPGYPYGLIDADDNARVRYEEVETYKVTLLSEISKLGHSSKFLRHMESIDTHDVMNLLRGASYA